MRSLVAGVFVALPARAASYYVATTGNDGAAGTEAQPFETIAKGASVANAGDTVFIRGGTYTTVVNLTKFGSATAWITFSAYPGELPIIDGGGGTGFGSATAQYVRVVGIAVRNWACTGSGNGRVNDTGTSNGNWQFV